MKDDYEILKLRVLMQLLKGDEESHTVSKISRILDVNKQRISRLLMDLEKDGIVDRKDQRKPCLTPEGRKQAAYYSERIKTSLNHLLFEGVSIEKAEQDAYRWALYNTDETMEVIKSAAVWQNAKYKLRNKKKFSGSELCKTLGDGVYHFNFVIYRERIKNGSSLSMANDGFEHPGRLVVKNGCGKIYLRISVIEASSPISSTPLAGKAVSVKYMENSDFINAELSNDIVSFPASALDFINIGENISQVLHGSVYIKIKCSIGSVYMPESTAVFNMMM